MVLSAKLRNRRLATPCTNYDTSGKNVESGVLFIAYAIPLSLAIYLTLSGLALVLCAAIAFMRKCDRK